MRTAFVYVKKLFVFSFDLRAFLSSHRNVLSPDKVVGFFVDFGKCLRICFFSFAVCPYISSNMTRPLIKGK